MHEGIAAGEPFLFGCIKFAMNRFILCLKELILGNNNDDGAYHDCSERP